ncbi:coiled-coil domain containing 164 [Nesidiocoris tenuis]|uniref:Coiled-coil domain containing 164 n=1 Tax=Nesidiocoris tenuis TaxID=355587 RepID=A0ABN7A789_9HEMI|nr:coiled-coil domain containing 164 [Nesidiocoris tenuis]
MQMLSGLVIFDQEEQEELEQQIGQRERGLIADSICTNPSHHSSITFCHVARALKEFALKLNEERRWEEMLQNDDLPRSSSRLLSLKEVEHFWQSMPKVFTVDQRLLWKSLLPQIKDYYKIILRKNQLKQENRRLERQNLELRRLLIRYLPPDYAKSKI